MSEKNHKRRQGGRFKTGWDLLRIPNLRSLWLGQTVSQIGDGLNKVALIWLVYSLTGSTFKATIIGVLQTLPPLLLGPVLGVYVDRFSKKILMIGVDILRAALVALIPTMQIMGILSLPKLYAVVLATAIAPTVFTPALQALLPCIVERQQFTAANALVNSTAMIGMLVGPAVSGIGIATIGINSVLFISSGAFLLSVLTISRLDSKASKQEPQAHKSGGFVEQLKKGLRYTFLERKTVGTIALIGLCYSLVASAFVFLLPQFGDKVLHAGAVTLGLLWSSYGAGMVAMSGWLAFTKVTDLSKRLLIVVIAMAAGGIASFLMSKTTGHMFAIALVAVIGAGLASFTPIVWGLLQEITPQGLGGRIFGIFNTSAMAASVVGMVGFGWATDQLGPQASLLGMATIFWVTGGTTLLLRQFGDLQPATKGGGTEQKKAAS